MCYHISEEKFMIVNSLSDEELAKIFAHFIYRDTEVEYFHSKTVRMDETLYKAIFRIVSSNLKKIARNHRLLAAIKEEELSSVLAAMYPTRAIEFVKYAKVFFDYCSFKAWMDWNTPVLLQTDIQKDKAAYILGGAFREGCTLHWPFDDVAMCRINKDVCNRTYTLIHAGLLPPPPHRRLIPTDRRSCC